MQKQAKQFIELLVSQQLLAPDIVDELNRQVSESKTKLSAELLAKLLVDNGHLTKFQATKLIAEVRDNPNESSTEGDSGSDEDELGFAPEIVEVVDPKAQSKEEKDVPQVAAVYLDEDAVEIAPVDVEPVDVVEVVDVEPIGSIPSPVVELEEDEIMDVVTAPIKVVKPPQAQVNPFDSFRILGVGLILALVCVVGIFLIRYFWRGNADERLKAADAAYSQRSYESAALEYEEFTKNFPADERASYATVRTALSLVRKDVESTPDPVIGLETASRVLPPIAEEDGLRDQQSDLAGALISLAEKFNQRADKTKETDERKRLMTEMAKLMKLIENPQFVGNAQRDQQKPTLDRIREDSKRIEREISTDDELKNALNVIDEQLAKEEVLAAYRTRKELTNSYPILKSNSELMKRVQRASEIQKVQVVPSSVAIELETDGIEPEIGGRIVLANSGGGTTAADLRGKTVFVKVKGSVYGIEGETGAVLWRRFVGRDFKNDPIRIDPRTESDVVVCDPEKGQVSRLEARTGATVWSASFPGPVHEPVMESEELFVATFDGTISCIDSEEGQTKWSTKLPQPVPVGATVAFNKSSVYVPGEHSNLYVLSRQNGTCKQVFYIDSKEGAIRVPPVLLMGQLFILENRNTISANIRILETDDEGLIARESPDYFQMNGNIVVSPKVDGRKLVVQSDLGECVVFDVEPTAETRKVSEIARVPRSSVTPQRSWIVAENNKVWIADSRLTRFDLQVTGQKLNRVWVMQPDDTFTGAPQKFGDTIVHTRTLQGSQGVRVAAVNADDGEPIWEIDLGIPVTFIASAGASGFHIVNSSAMYYGYNGPRLIHQADENPGKGRAAIQFNNPVVLDNGSTVLLNEAKPNQLALFTSGTKKLRLLSANFSGGTPSCEPVAVGSHFAVGLDNGQLVLIDPSSGALAANSYQQTIVPGQKVNWNRPVYFPSSKNLVVASNAQKIVRLGIGKSLRVLSEADLESAISGPLCAIGTKVAAVESTKSGDTLLTFDSTSLKRGDSLPLAGRLVSGPFSIGQDCIIQTTAKLMRVDANAKSVWELDFPNSALVSRPIDIAGQLLLATKSGEVWSVDPATGAVGGTTDVRQVLTSAAVPHTAGVLIGSDEGAVIALPIPTATAEAQ